MTPRWRVFAGIAEPSVRTSFGSLAPMSTFITKLVSTGSGPRVAVKDLIDVEGVPTTAGSRAVERSARAATQDASCLNGARKAGARLVGKANLHELAMLPFGINPWFGTPVNPLDPALIPGGSSSGSAVAVATDEADVAFGSDTGGSVRIPAACCGVTGLKTTHGRIPVDGVWPLAPSLDTIGPLAKDVAGVTLGMQLLEPGFMPAGAPAKTIGRIRTSALPEIEAAIDRALHEAELDVVSLDLPEMQAGTEAFITIYFSELWDADHHLLDQRDGIGDDIARSLEMAEFFRPNLDAARAQAEEWRLALFALFERVQLIALPTLPIFPPRIDDLVGDTTLTVIDITRFTSLFNAAGVPCTAQPVPAEGAPLPASLQLVGPIGSEELLIPTAAVVEAAV
jgi:amidase